MLLDEEEMLAFNQSQSVKLIFCTKSKLHDGRVRAECSLYVMSNSPVFSMCQSELSSNSKVIAKSISEV